MQPVAVAAVLMISLGFTLNPDGSGKVAVEISQPYYAVPQKDGRTPPIEAEMKDYLRNCLFCEGVDAWSDVSVGATKDSLLTFKGTAYFKDLSKFRQNEYGTMSTMTWSRDPKGDMVLELKPTGNDLEKPLAPPPAMTEAELASKVQQAQASWKRRKARIAEMEEDRIESFSFRLPAPAKDVSGLKAAADGTLRFVFDTNKCFQAADALMGDADYIKTCIKVGIDPGNDPRDPVLREKVFGSKGPFTARVAGDMKPQFDYAAEVKAAKEAFPKLLDSLGLPAEPAKPEPAATPKAGPEAAPK